LQIHKIRLRKDSSIWASVPIVDMAMVPLLSYPVFMTKPSNHHMHDTGSIVPHIRIKYNYYKKVSLMTIMTLSGTEEWKTP
jgi:hypothetical protein